MLHVSTRTGCAGAGFESSSVGDGTNRRPLVRSRMNGTPPLFSRVRSSGYSPCGGMSTAGGGGGSSPPWARPLPHRFS